MSKLIDKLNQVSPSAPQPMGFGARLPVSPKAKMLLIANLIEVNIDKPADYLAGADGGLVHISGLGAKTLQTVFPAVPEIPWGWWWEGGGQEEIEQIAKAGGDFVVFAANTPLAIPQGKELGRILKVETSLSEGLLRAISDLPIDAVLVTGESDDLCLTWHHLMLFRRVANLVAEPLLVTIPAKVTTDELQALQDAGVDGVVVEVPAGQPAGRLKALHEAIDKLPFPSPRKRRKLEAFLPRISRETEVPPEEEEEEE